MMGFERVPILGVNFDSLSMVEAVSVALEHIERRDAAYAVTPNPEIVWRCRKDHALSAAVESASLVLPDGVGITLAARILRRPLKQRLPGIDFALEVLKLLAQTKGSVYLLGAKPGVAELAGQKLAATFPGLRILGMRDGYFTDDGVVLQEINLLKPDLLFVCLGSPKQELWMQTHAASLDVGFMAGLGGSLDVFAGIVKRAPPAWQKLGLEWLYRLIRQPKRFWRMLKLPLFLLAAIKERLFKRG